MKTLILPSITLILALTTISDAQTRHPDFQPEQADRIAAIHDARLLRIREASLAAQQQAREAGREEARATIDRDQDFMAVWNGLTRDVRDMANARELAERILHRPEWQTQTLTQRIAAVTDFITNYPAIKAARPQLAMDTALGEPEAEFPGTPDVAGMVVSVQPLDIAAFPETEAHDLFTINRRFNWSKPHGQWMNQMLKDIDAAKAAGDPETYDRLTKQYSAWAEKYLRAD